MRRPIHALALASFLALGACSSGEVVVIAEIEVEDTEQPGTMRTLTLEDLEVDLIPFDRDQIFDSLTAAAANPEPSVPPELMEAQDSIRVAQERWQSMTTRWNALRDRMTAINEEIGNYAPAEPRYRELYSEFADVEGEYNRLNNQVDAAFARFDSLQKASLGASQELEIQIENWENEAFAEVDAVFLAKEREAGRTIMTDTTDVSGTTDAFVGLSEGRYWVTARYTLPFSELYWNVAVDVVAGEPIEVRLTRENATERPIL